MTDEPIGEPIEQEPEQENNPYFGIYEGKNVIFLQLEGIDTWLLTPEDMPNLYQLQQDRKRLMQ